MGQFTECFQVLVPQDLDRFLAESAHVFHHHEMVLPPFFFRAREIEKKRSSLAKRRIAVASAMESVSSRPSFGMPNSSFDRSSPPTSHRRAQLSTRGRAYSSTLKWGDSEHLELLWFGRHSAEQSRRARRERPLRSYSGSRWPSILRIPQRPRSSSHRENTGPGTDWTLHEAPLGVREALAEEPPGLPRAKRVPAPRIRACEAMSHVQSPKG